MELNGWIISTNRPSSGDNIQYHDICGKSNTQNAKIANTWYGWAMQDDVGIISASLKGSGDATLRYGNCYLYGTVTVYLDNVEISRAGPGEIHDVSFPYNHGSILKLQEDEGIIKLHQFNWNCSSKKIDSILSI